MTITIKPFCYQDASTHIYSVLIAIFKGDTLILNVYIFKQKQQSDCVRLYCAATLKKK